MAANTIMIKIDTVEKETWDAILALAEGGGGASALAGLSDVDLDNPSDGQVIQYDAASGKWKNVAGGSSGGFLKVGIDQETSTLDKTWQEIHDALGDGWYVSVAGASNNYASQFVVKEALIDDGNYDVHVVMGDGSVTFRTNSADGYPVSSDTPK